MGNLREWLNGTGYTVLKGSDDIEINDVVFDSRKAAPDTVFVCMKGSKTDSHSFMPDIINKGCRTIIVEKELDELPVSETDSLNIIKTENARETLSYLSAAAFGNPSEKMLMIGLTGTKGKTSTSYMMKTVLETGGRKVGVIGTNGCVIGDEHFDTLNTTPDSYELNGYFRKMLDAGCDTVVMECSSQGFKMDRTAGIIFDYGIFLNISPDHIGPLEHADFEEYLYCKSRLLTQCKTAIVNKDDEHFDELLAEPGLSYDRLITFSIKDPLADLSAYNMRFMTGADFAGTVFYTKGIISDSFRLSVPGEFNVSNVLSVLITAHDMGIKDSDINKALSSVHIEGRMEAVYKSDRFMVIVDYAHNEVSMVNLLKTLSAYPHKRLVVVFGCGGNRSKDRRIGMGKAAAKAADFCIFTSDNSRNEKPEDIIADIENAYLEAGGDTDGYIKIPDRRAAIEYAMKHAADGDIIAVIGKGHENYQEENGVRRHFLDKEEILKIKDELGL